MSDLAVTLKAAAKSLHFVSGRAVVSFISNDRST